MHNTEKKSSSSCGKNSKYPGEPCGKKTAGNNQWVSTGLARPDNHERRDGPGGENADK